MNKILKPYTIIPPELYVQRSADQQVQSIITDMGRPGYVLVSRQMGKTNLLLNAKRKFETANDIFVYIDLSNAFPDAKSCFENIIDTAIDTHDDKLGGTKELIDKRRKELKDTPPHKQHTNELRILLSALDGGKIIIILDEIDALTKTDYSDQIFSQIRSSYFASRVNYKEFYNLTYLLSGVVEPNEIIKDPKISPFNIGQKIYLNDFSREEFDDFIKLSKLTLDDNAIDRIYHWTNGNPRMTWDICSEIENHLEEHAITPDIIDEIVKKLYLTTFDRPPVDNIREIVKQDREIRNSIIEIEFKKGREISDKIKSKLYLSGIINYHKDDVCIKNEIIRQSLSFDWIRLLEEQEKGLLQIAMEAYQNELYSECLLTFEKFLSTNNFEETRDKPHYYYIMGHCAFLTEKFDKAVDYLEKSNFSEEDEAIWYYTNLNQRGLSYYCLNQFNESIDCLKKIVTSNKRNIIYGKALFNYGGIVLKALDTNYRDESIIIFEEIIQNSLVNGNPTNQLSREIVSIAYYNLGRSYQWINDLIKAREHFDIALKYANQNSKPKMLLSLLECVEDHSEKEVIIEELIDLLSIETPKEVEPDINRIIDFTLIDFRKIVLFSFIESKENLFEKLKPHLILLGDKPLVKHLYELALFCINEALALTTTQALLAEAYFIAKNSPVEQELLYKILKFSAYFEDIESPLKHFEYLELFRIQRHDAITYIDFAIIADAIFIFSSKRQFNEAKDYISVINGLRSTVSENTLLNYLIIDHLELNIYIYTKNTVKAFGKAKELLELIKNVKLRNQTSPLITEEIIETIKRNAQYIISPSVRDLKPIIAAKSYGRNELVKVRYKDGTILEVKFKKIQDDLREGICYILE